MSKESQNSIYSWVKKIIEIHISTDIDIECEKDITILSYKQHKKKIVIPKLKALWTIGSSDIPFSTVSFKGVDYPAPGLLKPQDISEDSSALSFDYDIIGLSFWMLSRAEEIGRKNLDEHGRFSAFKSHAYKYDYLDRPIVDEWFVILRQFLKEKWPKLKTVNRIFSVQVSHDVDLPSRYGFKSFRMLLKSMVVDLILRFDVSGFLIAPLIWITTGEKISSLDKVNCFDWIMDTSEENRLKSTFYFICGHHSAQYDADYKIDHPAIVNLIKNISSRGHRIGLHPSYMTFLNQNLIKQEADSLKKVLKSIKVSQSTIGSRMHYLRWVTPETARNLCSANIDYDCSLGYADLPGFRCGTCIEYPAFDPIKMEVIPITIRPLISMEGSVINDKYMGLGASKEAENKLLELKAKCRAVNGCFTLLWHNSNFGSNIRRSIYKSILRN